MVYKNVIYDLTSSGTSATWNTTGLFAGLGYGDKYYFNSVSLTGQLANSSSGLVAAFANGDGNSTDGNTGVCTNIDVRDNIFSLTGSSGTAGGNFWAFYTAATTLAGSTVNYNDEYCNGTNATNNVGRFNGLNYTTLATWQAATSQEANSLAVDPLFNSATNLQLQLGSPALGMANNSGTGVTTDILGAARSSGTPPAGATMGAYEVGVDAAGPAISYTLLTNTSCTTAPTISATITDVSGVDGNLGTRPRIYYKKSGDANAIVGNTNTDNGWKYVEASNSTSPFSLTPDFSLLLSAVTAGDVIQYFVVAQDLFGTPNVSINSGTFNAAPTSVALTGSAAPIGGTINSYSITAAGLSGTKTIPGDYATLSGAGGLFSVINTVGLAGNLTVNITADVLTEDGSVSLNTMASNVGCGSGGPFTLLIKPTATATLSGSTTGALIRINAADNVTIDGAIGSGSNTVCPAVTASRDLTITNTSAGTSSAVVWLQSNGENRSTQNTIKNCVITGNSNTTTLIGIGMGSSTISTSSLGSGNNNNSITNNSISKTQYGIYSQGASLGSKNTGNSINQNLLNTISPNNIQIGGIMVGFEDNVTIAGNIVSEMSRSSSTFGIAVGFVTSGFSTSTFTGNEVTNAAIYNNTIGNVTATGSFSAMGIAYASSASGTTSIRNNMIYGVTGGATASDFIAGIFVGGGAGTTNVFFNTVSMSGARPGTSSYPSYALAIGNTTPVVNVQNNILKNTQTASGAGQSYAIGLAYTSTLGNYANLISNNNNLYTSGGSAAFSKVGSLAQGSGTNKTTIALWNTETGRDATPASNSVDVTFSSPTNLHINTSNATNILNLNGTGATGTGISDDIDCDSRGSFPDIGADQFNAPGFWTGGTNTVWDGSTTGNWEDAIVPSGGSNIYIPAFVTNSPVITGINPSVANLYIGTGKTLSINGNTLTISGAVSGSGTLTGSNASNLVVNGTAGTIQFTSGSTNNYLKNLDMGAAGNMTIGSNGPNNAAGATPGV